MKANPGKYHFLSADTNVLEINIGDLIINSTKSEKLPGITTDNKLSFEQHVNSLCNKTSQKLSDDTSTRSVRRVIAILQGKSNERSNTDYLPTRPALQSACAIA